MFGLLIIAKRRLISNYSELILNQGDDKHATVDVKRNSIVQLASIDQIFAPEKNGSMNENWNLTHLISDPGALRRFVACVVAKRCSIHVPDVTI